MRQLFAVFLFCLPAMAQRPTYDVAIKYRIDAGGASITRPNRTGTGSPAGRDGCSVVGETYFQSDATPGKNLFYCTTTGDSGTAVWTAQTALRVISAVFSGAGSALTAGTTVPQYAACTTLAGAAKLMGYSILVDTGTATFKVWKNSSATAIPTVSDSISTSGFSIASGTKVHSTTLTDLSTTTFAAGDNLCVQLSAVSGSVTDAKLILEYF